MSIYLCSGHLFTETQCKVSGIKQMFIFISYSAHFSGVRVENREANCCGGRFLHFDFYTQLLFLHTTAIDETALCVLVFFSDLTQK